MNSNFDIFYLKTLENDQNVTNLTFKTQKTQILTNFVDNRVDMNRYK